MYFVAIVPEGPVQEEVTGFKKYLSVQYGSRAALKSPAHITLFPPFRYLSAKEQELFAAMEEAAYNKSFFDIRLQNFGCFFPRVVFVNVLENERLHELQRAVKHSFISIPGGNLKPDKRPYHPHMTIGNRDWEIDQFTAAWEFFSVQEYEATFTADKVCLLKLWQGKWEIVYSVSLNPTS